MNYFFPDSWFEFLANKSILLIFGTLVISFIALIKGADWFVEGAASIAKKLGISVIIIGVTIVSLGTTMPETTVSILAATGGKGGFAMGNAIGSVICNIGLILGLGLTIANIPVDKFITRRQGMIMFVTSAGLAILCYMLALANHHFIGRPIGILLLAILVWYIYKSIRWAKQHHERGITDVEEIKAGKSFGFLMFIFFVGLVVIISASKVLIASTTQICKRFGVPEDVIAATVVAFGTSVPELATGITSVIKGHKGILLGNIIGANILNILMVLGIPASVLQMKVDPIFYHLHFPFLILVVSLFMIFSLMSREFYKRIYGVVFLCIYGFYVIIQYLYG